MFELFNGVSDGELKDIYKDIKKARKTDYVPNLQILMQKSYKKFANLKCFHSQSILRKSCFIKKLQRGISQNNEVSMSIYYSFRLIPKRYESFLFAVNVSFGIRFHLSSKI